MPAGSTVRRGRSSSCRCSSAPVPTSSSPTSRPRWPRRSVADPPSPASNAGWFERARRVIPGGGASPVRSFASVGGTPYTVVSGQGPHVTDAEGNRYVDLVQSYGAVLLGHAPPVGTEAAAAAAARGATSGAPTPGVVAWLSCNGSLQFLGRRDVFIVISLPSHYGSLVKIKGRRRRGGLPFQARRAPGIRFG